MEGITDAPMRALQSETGNYRFAVSEFLRVSIEPLSKKVFLKEVPELNHGSCTKSQIPVQVQLLGGHPERMALSAITACSVGACGVDINFGCPAPTVNRHDGGATLLKYPQRIFEIVSAVREATPAGIPVSAKLRLGWDDIDAIYENSQMAAKGGASWITIHARTRTQGYLPPVYWRPIRTVGEMLDIPVVANGDIWTLDDFRRCQDETRRIHFMIGRGALANPALSYQIAEDLGCARFPTTPVLDWSRLLRRLVERMREFQSGSERHEVKRLKQWLRLASNHGDFLRFDEIKRAETLNEFFAALEAKADASPEIRTLAAKTLSLSEEKWTSGTEALA
jgi:tRNA-dihydrouridine synthase C